MDWKVPLLQYKNNLAVQINAHQRCDWSVACTEACGDIKESHNLIHHREATDIIHGER